MHRRVSGDGDGGPQFSALLSPGDPTRAADHSGLGVGLDISDMGQDYDSNDNTNTNNNNKGSMEMEMAEIGLGSGSGAAVSGTLTARLSDEVSVEDAPAHGSDARETAADGAPAARLSSNTQTFTNMIKSFVGTGILALPRAFRNSGMILGAVALGLIAIASLMCMQLLVKVKLKLKDRNVRTFGDIGFECLGVWGARLVDVMLLATQLGFCCGYFLFIGTSMHAFAPAVPVNVWILIVFPVLASLCLLRSLRRLAPIAMAGLAAIGVGIAFVIIYCLRRVTTPPAEGAAPVEHDAVLVKSFPLFFGIVVAAFEGIGLVLPTQGAMAKPEHYPRLLNWTVLVVGSLYLGVAIVGYTAFGRGTREVITLNLPQDDVGVVLVELCLVLAIVFTYPLQMHPVIEVLERSARVSQFTSAGVRKWRVNAVRISLVLLTLAVAVVVPKFDLLINLVGSLASATLAFILPAVFHYRAFRDTITTREIVLDAVFVVFGALGAVTGTALSIREIVREFDTAEGGA